MSRCASSSSVLSSTPTTRATVPHSRDGIRYPAQVNEIDPVGEPWCSRCCFLDSQAGFADAPGTDESHKPVVCDQARDFRDFVFPPKQPGQGSRQTRRPLPVITC